MAVSTATEHATVASTQPGAKAPSVQLQGVEKRFGEVIAVNNIDLEVKDGEFFSMLGPSGSGKTTTLRMIAGFELPTSGRILLHGNDVTSAPPFERDVNTVFQDYALFPHMTVGDNVAYGLMIKKVKSRDRQERVKEALRMVRLEDYEKRRPSQLSGGQRQRVALARALVNRPRVLLLDEPLGALDLRLREEMQIELKQIQQQVGITFIYVTHDQGEALTMSDRMAVFNQGRIEQIGSPGEVYENPHTPFVAGFVGTSNLIKDDAAQTVIGKRGTFTVRPEKIRISDPGEDAAEDETSALGTIAKVVYLGPETRYLVDLDAGPQLVVDQQNLRTTSSEALALEGKKVRLAWKRLHNLELGSEGDASASAIE